MLRRAFFLLFWEGAFAMAYENWLGAGYLGALAGELGASVGLASLILTLPWVGSLGQLLGIFFYDRFSSTKRYTVTVAIIARSLWLVPAAFSVYWFVRSERGVADFPTAAWLTVMASTLAISGLFALSSTVGWNSWLTTIIPRSLQGRFLGTRTGYVMGGVLVANLIGASLVGWKPGGLRFGYAALCGLGLLAAFISTLLLTRVPSSFRGSKGVAPLPPRQGAVLETLREPFRHEPFRKLFAFAMAFTGAMHLAGAYFGYYFTHDLHIPISRIAVWGTIGNLGAFASAAFWGRWVDRKESPVGLLKWCAHFMAISPLFYLSSSSEVISWIAPPEFFFNSVVSVGYQVALSSLLFRACPGGRNAVYFSVYTAGCGVAAALGTALGGQLASAFPSWGGFRMLWVLAASARLGVLWTLGRWLIPKTSGSAGGLEQQRAG